MKKLSSTRLFLLSAGLLGVLILASPLFFAPYWQPGYGSVDSGPLDLAACQLVELNTADAEELCTLPGVTPERARAILDLREVCGPFAELEQLLRADGITPDILRSWNELAWIRTPDETTE